MKYVILFVVAILLVRIDIVVGLGEKVVMMFQSEPAQERPDAYGEPPVIVRSESNVKLTPREQYLSFLESFRVTPEKGIRDQAMALFKDNPQIFSEKVLDSNLEARVYSWRDLVVQNEAEVPLFLLDLSNILKGPNKELITRFFSVVLDINFDMFIGSYPRTKDTTCTPVTLIEAAVPAEEKFPELFERMGILEEYLARENLPADRKLYATLCLDALKIYLDKQSAPAQAPAPETPPAETAPEAGTTP
jgi:hypothetical protein